ncbi:aminotransferase class I/II-fold pyridoxal phosphate-dependent enzyme [Micrococcus sp. ACRRV]|uniref:aminotransferase class I/II-fold pyridoxal phosphate-dependent enzyme n=1 Tax=Micrococcus sp. ACRRV TaxID=2918203 RepID=UPI001EF30463|nr:aminotransferase class I/II-fold pyridoxal phosphate-dependent enzyme [Micrococcus sp. ACRRV]MCG7421602.1 aminotransferase class I/II-fold pyridoxal phosphate-dependent enzyme [Micrococcus sp. ACRRV]
MSHDSPSPADAAAAPSDVRLAGPWRAASAAAGVLRDGAPVPTVFETMTALAVEHGAVNLGQGFPDADGPPELLALAAEAVTTGPNQYAPGTGRADLRAAVAAHRARHWGVTEDPDTQVLATTGATEAIAATVLALVRPGDEVITVEPFYDSHAAVVALAGGRHVTVPVHAPDFLPDPARIAAAITPRTRLLIVNTPHNPTGAVYPRALLEELVALCRARDVLMLSDEVYDHLVHEGRHVTLRAIPGAERIALTASSAGKSLAVTGWKVGWLTGPADLVAAVRGVKQFLSYSSGPAFQQAVAAFLPRADDFLAGQLARHRRSRDLLVSGLRDIGLDPVVPAAGYFTVVDLAPWGVRDAAAAARTWTERAGVAGIPVSALCRPDGDHLRSWLRLTFCKSEDTVAEAVARLTRHAADLRAG